MHWDRLNITILIIIILTTSITAQEKKDSMYSENTRTENYTDLVLKNKEEPYEKVVFESMQLNRTGSGNIIVTGTSMFHAAYHMGSSGTHGGINLVYNSINYCIGDSGSVGCYNVSGTNSSYLPYIQQNLNNNFNTDYSFNTISNIETIVDGDGEILYDVIAAGYGWNSGNFHSQSTISEYLEAGGSIILGQNLAQKSE